MARFQSPVFVRLRSVVDPEWIRLCLETSDLFHPCRCGYWLRPLEHGPRGWLAYEFGADAARAGHEPDADEARRAWSLGEVLPARYVAIDYALALRAWGMGVLEFGQSWFTHGDGVTVDRVVQKTLFDELRYG